MDYPDKYLLIESSKSSEYYMKILSKKDQIDLTNADKYNQLLEKLLKDPYPTLQIFKNTLPNNIIQLAIEQLCKNNLNSTENISKLLNLLANFDEKTCPKNVLDNILQQINDNKSILGKTIYLSLLGRMDFILLNKYLSHEQDKEQFPNSKFFLENICQNNEHSFMIAIHTNITAINSINNPIIRNLLKLLQIISKLENESIEDADKNFQTIDIVADQLNGALNLICMDVCRIKSLVGLFKQCEINCNQIKTQQLMQPNGILQLFHDNPNYGLLMCFDDLKKLTETNYEYNLKFNNDETTRLPLRNYELEIFAYYFILKTVFELITSNHMVNSVSWESQVLSLKATVRHLRDISVLCSLLDDIFKILFMRWDQLVNNSSGNINGNLKDDTKKLPKLSGAEIEINVSGNNLHKTGFICNSETLKVILTFLKTFIVKRSHTIEYKNSAEELKLKFVKYSESINDALRKLSLFEKYSNQSNTFITIHLDDILPIIKLHINPFEKTSSDDEKNNKKGNFSSLRRKTKTRKKSSLGNSTSHSKNSNEKELNDKKSKIDRGIISKMLGTPESMAVYALGMENITNVKYIIELYNLQNTELENELKFLENMQIQRKRLQTIYEQYKQQEQQTANIQSVIERIKKVAAIGFEVSKIINIIEKFAESNQIEQSDERKILIEKYSKNENYQYLQQYYGKQQLQVIHIFDLIFNSNFNHDICCNIMNIIKRICGPFDNNNGYKGIGCIPFFNNITECMRILKNHKTNIGFQEILCTNLYSLRPHRLETEIEKSKSFFVVFEKTESQIEHFEDLKVLAHYFETFQSSTNYYLRFYNYIKNLSNLLRLRDKNFEFDLSDMIKVDPKNIIGDLIFVNHMTPNDIENYVYSLNLNLLHVIASNLCPEILNISTRKYMKNTNRKSGHIQNVYNYITGQNLLLGYLIQKLGNQNCEIVPEFAAANIEEDFLNNYLQLNEIQILANLFNGNIYIAGLLYDQIVFDRLNEMDNDDDKIELLQHFIETKDTRIRNEIDKIMINLILKNPDNIYLIYYLQDILKQAEVLCENFFKMKDPLIAESLINNILLDARIEYVPIVMTEKLKNLLKNIKIYSKILKCMPVENWTDVHQISITSPSTVLKKLLVFRKYQLILKWSEILPSTILLASKYQFFELILHNLIDIPDQSYEFLIQVIEKFPLNDVIHFYTTHKEKFQNISLFSYIIQFLITNTDENHFRNYLISIKIFEFMSIDEKRDNWNLLNNPLLLIEQSLMNCKFEIFTKMIEAIKPMLDKNEICKFCTEQNACNIYDIHTSKSSPINKFSLMSNKDITNTTTTEFLLLNFNLYQKDHIITIECIDLLLRIYATKALDYQINEHYLSSVSTQQSNDMTSLDSLYESFEMPPNAPNKSDWIRDKDATHCMCCRRAIFTMLIRRHHCRRCGRVVCFACSTSQMIIPELYENIKVRVCSDCVKKTEDIENRNLSQKNRKDSETQATDQTNNDNNKWQLSGNLTHDKLLREEFCYEHAPSVALCLSILAFHTNNSICINLLLYHCRKLKKLFIPNPEVDYALVAKMMSCLALAAKVRGGPPECDVIRTHSDIIKSIVQHGCESLLPPEPLNNISLRKLGDSLVLAEEWSLALEVFLKSGFSITGVMVAHGLSCLRAGCFEIAREKLNLCLPAVCQKEDGSIILKLITNECEIDTKDDDYHIPIIKRPNRSPPLLSEIVKIIETTSNVSHQQETLRRATIIRNSNTSLTSQRTQSSTKRNLPINEPALNILQTLSNLKQIKRGNYETFECIDKKKLTIRQSRFFEESLYYMLLYGSHSDILNFLIRHRETMCALRYYNLQKIDDSEIFIQTIFMKFLKTGTVDVLITHMLEIDERLLIWKDIIINICRYLENKQHLNSLHQLQILLKDPVRASMTCVKFYSMNVTTFKELQNNSFHLFNADAHLKSELELCQWENININNKRSNPIESTFLMQMDARTLNRHIHTISRQLEVTKFLVQVEANTNSTITPIKILKELRPDETGIPTLFDSVNEKIQICILILVSGKNIDEGFGLAFRIIQDYKLPEMKVYGGTTKYLTNNDRLIEVDKLISCIATNNNNSTNTTRNTQNLNQIKCKDEILSIAIHSTINIHRPGIKSALNQLIKRIENIELQISCHIYIGQLKSAYLLAIHHKRLNDVRKILRQAETTNQPHIKKLCEKKLNIHN